MIAEIIQIHSVFLLNAKIKALVVIRYNPTE